MSTTKWPITVSIICHYSGIGRHDMDTDQDKYCVSIADICVVLTLLFS